MPAESRIVRPGPSIQTYLAEDGTTLTVPEGWSFLVPGNATVTRRVKKAGPHWVVQVRRGRRTLSRGVWAPSSTIERIELEWREEEKDPRRLKRLEKSRLDRDREQEAYVLSFQKAVVEFLDFHSRYSGIADRLSQLVTEHSTPVGSGTVARTKRLELPEKARAAVIAWMRHNTTKYETMSIARVKGNRREVRRTLAAQSLNLLENYRKGSEIKISCPLRQALVASE